MTEHETTRSMKIGMKDLPTIDLHDDDAYG
jgi:hypothetical protein